MDTNDRSDADQTATVPGYGCVMTIFEGLKKYAPLALLALIILIVLFQIARASVYKIRPWERGLHVRGGKFLSVDEPG